ncbi:hypothetical protein X744_19240 [Mesorhizobium sp. LNJC372A00]|nr:hypothetical protein X745_11955 [Mesorhizobium sp. LNJC374B00]ESY57242.1 hypothetical protein X744_19240 [Mesorhizobium sp. LNJC372A00]
MRRARGLTLELVAAAGTARLFDAASPGNAGWRLMVVVSTESRDERHVVVAEAVDQDSVKRMFGYVAPKALIADGAFVSVKGDLISFLHPETLSHVTVMDGTTFGQAVDENVAPHRPAPERARPVPTTIINKARLIKKATLRQGERPDMTEAETIHFHGPKINVAQICDRLGPSLKAMPGWGSVSPGTWPCTSTRMGTRQPRAPLGRRVLSIFFSPWFFQIHPGVLAKNRRYHRCGRNCSPITTLVRLLRRTSPAAFRRWVA